MAEFSLKLTQGGAELLAKAKLGKQLNFKYITLGSGVYEGNPQEATAFVNKVIDLNIQEKTRKDTVAFLKATLTYNAVPDGFVWTELGVIAIDPDTQEEVLYMYDAIDIGEVIPPATSATQIEKVIQVASYVSNAPNISVVIDESLINIPKSDIGQPNGVAPLNEDGVLDIIYGGTKAKTAGEAIYNLGASPNKNLLLNPFFQINQRDKTNYTGNADYCVDGWIRNKNINVTINNKNQIVITPIAVENPELYQKIDNYTELLGKTLTFSVYMSTGNFFTVTGTLPSTLPSQATVITKVDTPFGNIRIQLQPENLLVVLDGSTQVAFSPLATKLEIGENQSLARQNSTGAWELIENPDPLEILKCQKYLLCWNRFNWIGSGVVNPDGQKIQFFVPTPIKMRIVPTAIGSIYIWDGKQNYGPYTFKVTECDVNGLHGTVDDISSSELIAGTVVFLNTPAKAETGSICGFFAEL